MSAGTRWRRARRLVALAAAAAATVAGGGTALADDVRGSDVSGWQHTGNVAIDWNRVSADGESFTFVKATEGVGFVSKTFAADWQASRSAGLVRGAYHFARPSVGSAVAQADYFVDTVGGFGSPGDLPPVLDLEVTGNLTPAQLIVWTGQWLTEVKTRSGRTPMIYTSPNFWQTKLNNSKAFLAYPLWVARYASAPSALVWPRWTFWQYTQTGKLPGITGAVDRNVFNGSIDQLRAMANLPARPVTPPVTTTPTTSPTVSPGTSRGTSPPGTKAPVTTVSGPNAPKAPMAAAPAPAAALPAAGRLAVAIQGSPGVAGRPDGGVVTVARTATGATWARYANGKWDGPHALAGPIASDPRLVVAANGQLDVFARSANGTLRQRTRLANGTWRPWRSLGGHLVGTPAVTSPSAGVYVVVSRGTDSRLWTRRYAGGRWGAWQNTGALLTGDPALVTAGGQLTLVARISGGRLATSTLTSTPRGGAGTTRWTALAGPASGTPTMAADGSRVTLVVRDSHQVLHRRVRTAGRWSGWQTVAGPAGTGATVTILGTGDYVFATGTAHDLRYRRI